MTLTCHSSGIRRLTVGIRCLQLRVKNQTFGYRSAQTLLPMPGLDRARPQAGPQEDNATGEKSQSLLPRAVGGRLLEGAQLGDCGMAVHGCI